MAMLVYRRVRQQASIFSSIHFNILDGFGAWFVIIWNNHLAGPYGRLRFKVTMTRKKGVYHELRLGAGEGTIRDDIWGTDKVSVLQTFTRIHGRKAEVSLHPALPFACPQKAGGPNLKKYFPLPPQISLQGAWGVSSEWKNSHPGRILLFSGQIIATENTTEFPPNGGLK